MCTFEKPLLKPFFKHIAFLSLGIIYMLFQTQNAMVDSWYYSACVKFKNELLNSHHLLYNYFGYYWFSLLKAMDANIEAIYALNIMNAFASVTCLYLVYHCLIKLNVNTTAATWLSLFCGVSFGVMRYATDAETYILPIVFSLGSTLLFINHSKPSHLFFAGVLAAIAILFHQVQLWWSLAISVSFFIGKTKNYKGLFIFASPLLLVPLVYWIAFNNANYHLSFLQFVAGEFGKGNAGIDLSVKALLLTLINLFRTFLQVHGNILVLFKFYPLIASISFILFLIAAFLALKNLNFKTIKPLQLRPYKPVFLLAIFLQILFALISSGNAEFMVMLPFLLVLYFASAYQFQGFVFIRYLALSLLIWNLAFAIIPNAKLTISRVDTQVAFSEKYSMAYGLWKNKPLVENQLSYFNGFNKFNDQLLNPKNVTISLVDSLLKKGNTIYTDLPNTNKIFSRESMVEDNTIKKLIDHCAFVKCDSFINIYGKNYIYYIQKRMY